MYHWTERVFLRGFWYCFYVDDVGRSTKRSGVAVLWSARRQPVSPLRLLWPHEGFGATGYGAEVYYVISGRRGYPAGRGRADTGDRSSTALLRTPMFRLARSWPWKGGCTVGAAGETFLSARRAKEQERGSGSASPTPSRGLPAWLEEHMMCSARILRWHAAGMATYM